MAVFDAVEWYEVCTKPIQRCHSSTLSRFPSGTVHRGTVACQNRVSTQNMADEIPPFSEWPLWAQVLLVVPSIMLPVPLYFFGALLRQCAADRATKRRFSKADGARPDDEARQSAS